MLISSWGFILQRARLILTREIPSLVIIVYDAESTKYCYLQTA